MPRDPRALAKALIAANRTAADSGMGGFGQAPMITSTGQQSPLVQGYAAWTSGAVPRDPATFLTGSFGPLQPMVPAPIDAPNPDTDRVDPRRWQYTPGWNIPHGQPGDEGLKLASFANLRTIGDTYSVARACIQLRKDELVGLGWDVVPTKAAEKAMRGDAAKRKEFDARRAKMVTFWKRPDQQYFSFRDWFSVLLEEVLVTDALSLYLWPSRAKGKGVLGSNLSQLASIDGSTIRPLLDVHGGTPLPPNPGFQQYLYGVPRSDLVTMHSGDDIAGMSDALTREYQADQLIYRPQTPRNWTPYGFAPIERALVPILSGIQRQQFQLNYFSEGSIPGLFVSAGDPNATPSQLRELQDALNAMAGDPGWKHKIIVLPQGSRTDPQRPAELAGTFDEIIMTQVCMAFSVMPMELGISPRTSSTQSHGAANQMAKTSQDTQQRKGNIPLLEWFADIFNHVIQGVCGQDDMQWWWEGLDTGEDEEKQTNIQKAKISIGLMSIDEGRIEDGKQPWGLPTTSDPVLITATGVIPYGSIDPKTGLPEGHPEQQQPPEGPAAGPVAPGGPKPTPKPKPAPAGATAGAAATPAHAGARANASTTATAAKPAPAGATPKPAPVKKADTASERIEPYLAEPKVDTFAALRELDLIRRRVVKGGRGLSGWSREHIPADLFDTLDGTSVSIERARRAVKGIGLRQRREEAVSAGQQLVVDGLRKLAAGLEAGTVATPTFVDQAVEVLRGGIRSGLAAGAAHALSDLGHLSPVTKYAAVASYDSRFFQYASAIKSGYEAGRGLTTFATGDGKWLARWDATSARPCDLCDERDGHLYEIGTIPGYPGMGGFGAGATVCRGGTNCKCEITYLHSSDGEDVRNPGPPDLAMAAAQQAHAASVTAARRAMTAAMPTLVEGAGSVTTDPDAYETFLDDLAEQMAQQQRPYLDGLLQDLLTSSGVVAVPLSMARDVAEAPALATPALVGAQVYSQWEAAPVTKHGGHADLTHEVYAYLARQYPASVLEWVKTAHWHAPQTVDLADIEMARRPGGARNQDKVDAIEAYLTSGQALHPIVLVRTPEGLPYKIADGYHRTMALQHAGRGTVEAYIGDVTSDDGPWGAAMNRAKLTKSAGPNAAGLAVQAKDTGRVLMLQRAVDPTDRAGGLWEFPGGRLDGSEDPETAARREFTEETGLEVPDGKITGSWTSPNGVYTGFVLRVKHESDVDIFGERDAAVNPDDPDGDHVEALAWWDPRQLHDNPAVRPELAADLTNVLYVLHPPSIEKGRPHPGQHYTHGWHLIGVEDGDRVVPHDHLDVPRKEMPQLVGVVGRKFADFRKEFERQLAADGIGVTRERVPAASLRATQNEVNRIKVGGMADAVRSGDPAALTSMAKPIYISRDSRVIDGHHKWAAGVLTGHDLTASRIDLDAEAALAYARRFAESKGIGTRGVEEMAGAGVPAQKGHPHPGQRYRHGWIPVEGGGGAKESLQALRDMKPGTATREQMLSHGQAIFGGEFGGLKAEVTGAMRKDDHVMFSSTIKDANGKYAGVARRRIHFEPGGEAYAEHWQLELEPHVQGQGFAEAFNANAEQWYRDAGINRIELTANVDVGGYAWARSGYDWANGKVPLDIRGQLAEQWSKTRDPDLGAVMDRIDAGEPVSAYEISQLGRPPGASGKDATWPGKALLLNSKWEGVKWL